MQVVVALVGNQKVFVREKAIAVFFLIIKQVMGTILAEKNHAYGCACSNFVASVLLYDTEFQVLEILIIISES